MDSVQSDMREYSKSETFKFHRDQVLKAQRTVAYGFIFVGICIGLVLHGLLASVDLPASSHTRTADRVWEWIFTLPGYIWAVLALVLSVVGYFLSSSFFLELEDASQRAQMNWFGRLIRVAEKNRVSMNAETLTALIGSPEAGRLDEEMA
jgi:hypothetical protein